MSSNSDMSDSPGYIYGLGTALGAFASLFVLAGLFLFLTSCSECCGSKQWKKKKDYGLLVSVFFRCVFALLFLGVPAIIYFAMHMLLAVIIGYSIPGFIVLLYAAFVVRARGSSTQRLHDSCEVSEWLHSIGLIEYYAVLSKQGYETMEKLQTLSVEEMKDMGITLTHIDLIMSKRTTRKTQLSIRKSANEVKVDIATLGTPSSEVQTPLPSSYPNGTPNVNC